MMRKRWRWALTLVFLVGANFIAGCAAPGQMAASTSSNAPVALGRPQPANNPEPNTAATLQRPTPSTDPLLTLPPLPPRSSDDVPAVTPVTYQEPIQTVSAPAPDGQYQSMYQPPPPAPPPGVPPPPPPPYGAPQGEYIPNPQYGQPVAQPNSFWDSVQHWFTAPGGGKGGFCYCDHEMDGFASPITNPFFMEDPRALTEIKPLFILQDSPNRNPIFGGGNSYFYGVQGRVAFCDSLSLVVNKLGFVTFDPNNPTPDLGKNTGFAEVNVGPKWTFLHTTQSTTGASTAAAVGVNFDLAIGSSEVLQNTGSLSVDPYFSIAQSFWRTSFGQVDVMNTTGVAIGADGKRADIFHSGLHFDYDIANAKRWYPCLELNWFHYLRSGNAHDDLDGTEGLDLGNFGSTSAAQRDFVSIAPGFRYKFSEKCQLGIAAEFPVTSPRDIQDFRLTLDFIFRF